MWRGRCGCGDCGGKPKIAAEVKIARSVDVGVGIVAGKSM